MINNVFTIHNYHGHHSPVTGMQLSENTELYS